ncbi:hypothetical protein [Larsenimonas suaedae]|uniref:Uncharacterized protein n=1 Tax=Larsenimonas suaedae TaxID=1851019 RepID=A0ABU1GZ08_9GAMM|nr:hypothetical protein [Larsenimonas suaedae]MCM2973760.1 hypothetical protein [Larsenimonas suaedae]MDR5897284.1 hypothetical protein [Larsenimonas suaedae]
MATVTISVTDLERGKVQIALGGDPLQEGRPPTHAHAVALILAEQIKHITFGNELRGISLNPGQYSRQIH